MSKGRPDKERAPIDRGRADPTIEIEPRPDDASVEREFDAPTQLVDASAYASTLVRAARSDEQRPVEEEDHEATQLSPPPKAPAPTPPAPTPPAPSTTGDAPAVSGGLFPDLPHVQLPQQLGQYTLLELLGLGGMAEVFLAQQDGPSGFRRKLVIKRIHPHLSVDERFVKMFLREARVAAGLQHRNIVRIDELGADKGIYYIAMELIDGLTLQRLARRAWRAGLSLPMELVLSAAADAASALHYAHSYVDPDGTARRIVHRDVSPDNLIVDRAGNTKLLDFGVAKAAGTISVTRAGEVKGKVPYMAPEQLHGRPLDGRSDLYSLGATLYWLLTGKRPFRGETDLEVMQAIAYDTPVRPRELNSAIPEVVESIILRLLEKRPEDRHANGQMVADELTALLPPSRREVAAFVEQTMALESDDDAEPISASSFVAATPRTAHFISEARRAWIEGFAPGEGFGAHPDDEETVAAAEEVVELGDPEPLDVGDEAVPLDAEDDVPPPAMAAPPLETPLASDTIAPHAAASVEVPAPRRVPLVAVAAGAGAAVLLALLGWALLHGDEAPPVGVASVASVAPPRATDGDDAAWDFLDENAEGNGARRTGPAPSAGTAARPDDGAVPQRASAAEESNESRKRARGQAPAGDDEPRADHPSLDGDHDAPVDVADGDDAKAKRVVEAAPTVKVKASGPANVAWRIGKRTLGSGDTTLEVPEGTSSVVAYHRGRQVRTRIPIRDGKVSYADAPTGTLDIRVLPYATIYAGSEKLWKVPAPPRAVPAGTYRLRIEYEGKSKTEKVTVEPGGTAKVRVNMME